MPFRFIDGVVVINGLDDFDGVPPAGISFENYAKMMSGKNEKLKYLRG
ncbi:MAG: hypothetical protein KKB25_01460 [Nanoarchaeota archaeon]|nr:hypothetical protein [Nanoarchaeota archaeon]